MAHSLSAKKRIRQNEKRRLLNRSRRSALRGRLRQCRDALVHSELTKAQDEFRLVVQALDREASRGLIHPNEAARRKSRLARHINQLRQKLNEREQPAQ